MKRLARSRRFPFAWAALALSLGLAGAEDDENSNPSKNGEGGPESLPYVIEPVTLPEAVTGRVAHLDFAPDGTWLLLTRNGQIYRRTEEGKEWEPWSLAGFDGATGLLADYWPRSVFVVHATGISRLFDTDDDSTCDFVKAAIPAWRFNTLGELFRGPPVVFPNGDLLLAPNVREGSWAGMVMRVPEAAPIATWLFGPYHFSNPIPGLDQHWLIAGRLRDDEWESAAAKGGLWLTPIPKIPEEETEPLEPLVPESDTEDDTSLLLRV